jgi:hypothetical protein
MKSTGTAAAQASLSAVPNVDTLLTTTKTTKRKKSMPSAVATVVTADVKSVTPTKKKKSLIVTPQSDMPPIKKKSPPPPKEKKSKKKQFVEVIPQEITKPTKPIVENKSLGIDNINVILDSIENVSILDIISSSENPDMTNMFNNLLAIS